MNDGAGKASWRKNVLTVLNSWYYLDIVSLGACGRGSLMLKSSLWWGSDLRGIFSNSRVMNRFSWKIPMHRNYCSLPICPVVSQTWSQVRSTWVLFGAGKVRKPVTLGCWLKLPFPQQIVLNAESLLELGNMSSHWLQHMQGMGWHFSWCWNLSP